MSIVDELTEEMEVLESIYAEEFVQTSDNTYYIELPTEHITLYINVKNNKDSLLPRIHLSTTIVKDIIPSGISESFPRGTEWTQFTDKDAEDILNIANEQVYPDSVVVFGVASAIQEAIEVLFEKKYKDRHAKPTMELSDAQLQGTKVTKESFKEWWCKFRVKVVVEPKKKNKLTGKELFEQGAVKLEEEQDDGVDVDYSLFANEHIEDE